MISQARRLAALACIVVMCAALARGAPADHGRRISFSGYDWWVKSSSTRVGPGPNRFSDSERNVAVDQNDRLHMTIQPDQNGTWTCAEIVSVRSFGYGTYRFRIGQVGAMDRNAVLGLFTWSDNPAFHHREIDVEISRWSDSAKPNAQFVVQPYNLKQNIFRFEVAGALSDSVHEFFWAEEAVHFQSHASQVLLGEFRVTANVPAAGGENARINLWLNRGQPPTVTHSIEITVDSFEFLPLPAAASAPAPIRREANDRRVSHLHATSIDHERSV